jgi:hypothetical protein
MKKTTIAIITVTLVILTAISARFYTFNDHTYTVTITDKERVVKENESKYLIFAETADGETMVFENTDNALRLKFNSSDIQGELKIGETYTITVVGFRFRIASMYENIIKVD